MTFKTEQEAFWHGDFGDAYTQRNSGAAMLGSATAFFAKALARAHGLGSALELGANRGVNLEALRRLFPALELHAVEINPTAARVLAETLPDVNLTVGSLLDYRPDAEFDLVLVKGVLIHLAPEVLPEVYATLYASCRRYLLVAEYYNPTPVTVTYRGHEGRLFKRDFAGELLDRYPTLRLLDYGFAYHRDPLHPQDDLTWFLMERSPDGDAAP